MLEKNKVQNQVPLKGFSTFKVGGPASHFYTLLNKSDLKDVINFAKDNNLPIFFLGGGSNILFHDDGFNGLVLNIATKGISYKSDKDFVLVASEAGENWDSFVSYTLSNGFFGLENLSSIPGTIGASAVQNIGAYGREVKDLIYSVEVFDTETSEFKTLTNNECEFDYRHSIFKTEKGKKLIVTRVTFKLPTHPAINISYKDLSNYFGSKTNPTPVEVREAVIKIRAGKFPDLNIYGTAGSFFKNIICKKEEIEKIKNDFPDLPVYDVGNGMVKISTAFVLDKICGLKGYRIGDVGLYENQTLVVVNYGHATGQEIREFINSVKSIIKEKTGINIEEEVILA